MSVAAMMELASRGQALVLHIPEEDCEARFRLYVDEEPPQELRLKGQLVVADARLLVPGGLVRADGLEFLCRVGESCVHSEPQVATVPNGVYLIEVLSLLGWKAANRIAEGRRGISRMPRTAHLLVFAYTWPGILMFPANLFVAPLVVTRFWRAGIGTSKIVRRLIRGDYQGLTRPAGAALYDSRLDAYPFGPVTAPPALEPVGLEAGLAHERLAGAHARFFEELRRFASDDPDALVAPDPDSSLWFTLSGWVRLQSLHEAHHILQIKELAQAWRK